MLNFPVASTDIVVQGLTNLRGSILVQETMWFDMNYLQQTAFMQLFDCTMGGAAGKHLLYMDVRSLATGQIGGDLDAWHPKPNTVSFESQAAEYARADRAPSVN
jgi:hypothetical protein